MDPSDRNDKNANFVSQQNAKKISIITRANSDTTATFILRNKSSRSKQSSGFRFSAKRKKKVAIIKNEQ